MRNLRPLLLSSALALTTLACVATSAQAEIHREYIGQLPVSQPPVNGCGVAVDPATQDAYVAGVGGDAVDVFGAKGEELSQITELSSLAPPGALSGCSIAVSGVTGNLYVVSAGKVFVFNSAGTYTETLAGGPAAYVAVDPVSGDVYTDETRVNPVSLAEEVVVERYNSANVLQPSPFAITNIVKPIGFAVDGSGDVYVAEEGNELSERVTGLNNDEESSGVYEFNSAGMQVGLIAPKNEGLFGRKADTFGRLKSIAADSAGNVYVAEYEDLHGITGSSYGQAYEQVETAIYEFNSAGVLVGELTGTPSGAFGFFLEGVAATPSGNLYVADDSAIDAFGPGFAIPAKIDGESFSSVDSTTANVNAKINDFDASDISYFYEYGTSGAYGKTTPVVSLPAGKGDTSAPARLSGLQPETVYHFRVVATSPTEGKVEGADVTFTTPPVPTLGLPDGRVYELVSSPQQDAEVYVPFGSKAKYMPSAFAQFQAAADGNAVAYPGSPSGPGGNGNEGTEQNGNEYVARRGSGGWESQDVQPPGSESAFYQAFTSDLSVGFLAADGPSPLGSEAGEVDADLPAGSKFGYLDLYAHPFGGESYAPLFTTRPPHTEPAGSGPSGGFGPDEFRSYGFQEFGDHSKAGLSEIEGLAFAGATQDLSHVLFAANDALQGARPRAVFGGETENNLYDSGEGQLRLVNVLPDGKTEPGAAFGGQGPSLSHVISTDGSKIYWTDEHEGPNDGHVFLRENDGQPKSKLGPDGECTEPENACTIAVSAGAAQFWTATPDGRFAFYVEAGGLYRFNLESQAREPLAPTGSGVEGVIGVSETGEAGEYAYFVATGEALASGAKEGQPNLYLRHGATTTMIATLNPVDDDNQSFSSSHGGSITAGDWQANLGSRTAEVSPDGHSVVFMSQASLPTVNFPDGYDNAGQNEVYVYQAGGGGLFCASCDPSGAPPPIVTGKGSWLQYTVSDTHQMRWLSDSGGRVFFDSLEPLVAQDINGAADVYEWERSGVGSCARATGCIYLLSGGGGSSGNASFLVDAGASGDDVFIATRAQLLPQDKDESIDVYDASADPLPVSAPSQCTQTGCQGVPDAPPVFATPAGVTFEGVGNFTGGRASNPPAVKPKVKKKPVKCMRGYVKKHNKCTKKPKAKKSATKGRK